MILDQFNDFVRLANLYHQGHIRADAIAEQLGISLRHTWRLLGEAHPPQSHRAWNRLSPDIRQFIITQKTDH